MKTLGLEPLNLEKALKLYDILQEFLPVDAANLSLLDLSGKIVQNMIESDPKAFFDAIQLMSSASEEELKAFSGEYLAQMFVAGLSVNDFDGLIRFCKGIGYA